MFDIKTRQEWLKYNAEVLQIVSNEFVCDSLAFEYEGNSYVDFTDKASEFSLQFRDRAILYDDPHFRNARDDGALKWAAIARKVEAQKYLDEFHTRDFGQWNDDATAEEQLNRAKAACIAEAQKAECEFILRALEGIPA